MMQSAIACPGPIAFALVHKPSKAVPDTVMKAGEKYFGALIFSPLDSRLFGRFPGYYI